MTMRIRVPMPMYMGSSVAVVGRIYLLACPFPTPHKPLGSGGYGAAP